MCTPKTVVQQWLAKLRRKRLFNTNWQNYAENCCSTLVGKITPKTAAQLWSAKLRQKLQFNTGRPNYAENCSSTLVSKITPKTAVQHESAKVQTTFLFKLGNSLSICCRNPNLLTSLSQLFFSCFTTLLLRVFWPFLPFVGCIILTLRKETHCRELWILAPRWWLCDQGRTVSLFCGQQVLHKVEIILIKLKDREYAMCREF